MAIYFPPKDIKVECSACGHTEVKIVPHDYIMDWRNRAQWHCPRCGFFTLRDASIPKSVMEKLEEWRKDNATL